MSLIGITMPVDYQDIVAIAQISQKLYIMVGPVNGTDLG